MAASFQYEFEISCSSVGIYNLQFLYGLMIRFVQQVNDNHDDGAIVAYFEGSGLKREDIVSLITLCKKQEIKIADLRIPKEAKNKKHKKVAPPQYEIPQEFLEEKRESSSLLTFIWGLILACFFFFSVNHFLWNILDDGSDGMSIAIQYGSFFLGLIISKVTFSPNNRIAAGFIVGNIVLGLLEGFTGIWFGGNVFFISAG